MKKSIIKVLLLTLIIGFYSCTSGHNSPADSHPGSGSVKAGSNTENTDAQTDTTAKDSSSGKNKH